MATENNTSSLRGTKQSVSLIPKLRFDEFVGEWEKVDLGKTCIVKTGGSDTQDKVNDGEYPFFVRSNTVEKINTYSFDGEAILTSGDGVGVGKNFHYINGKFDFHQRVYALHTFKEEYSGKFIYQVFVEKFYKRVMRLSAKNSVDSVRMSMITEMKMGIPNLPEQQKIASFLTLVDTKIQQLTTKKQLLENYKKGVMQKLFSQQLRFKNDDGFGFPDWEEKKLGEIGNFKTSSVDKKIVQGQKIINLVNYMNVYRHEEILNKNLNNLMKVSANETQLKMSNLKKGDILFTPSSETPSDIGHSVVIFEDLKDTLYSYHLMRFRPKFNLDLMYSHYFCNTQNVLKQISRFATGSTRFTISVDSFSKIIVLIPSLKEQQKIANYLSAIDTKIENVQTQIEKTQTFKKGLLQQMFV
jgi:type I restriction enzyme S subunit